MNGPRGKIEVKVVIGVLIAVAAVAGIAAVFLADVTGRTGSGLSQAYDYDSARLGKVDPNLILYAETGAPIPTGFNQSRAIALDSEGRIYVAGDQAVSVLSPTGNAERVINLTGAARCVALAPDGRTYIGLSNHVEVFDAAGQRLATWEGLGERAVLTSIAVAKNDVLVADAGNRVVLRYDTEGTLVNRIGAKDSPKNVPGFLIPSAYFDVAMAPDGLLRVANPGQTRIEAYTLEGDFELSWGKNGVGIDRFCGCCNPVNFALLPDGSYVTAEKGLIRVKVYNPDGSFKAVVAGPEQLVKGGASRVFENAAAAEVSGFDVAVDANGRVYVLDTIENTVRIFVKSKGNG